jgi:hypothetical protein
MSVVANRLNQPSKQHEALFALTGWIKSVAESNSAYALIDMAAMPSDQDVNQVLRQIRAVGALPILDDARPEALRASPWLVPLSHCTDANRKIVAASMGWAFRGPCVTWLSSPLQLQELASRLRQRTEAMLPERQPVLLRCYDPRVLPELHQVLQQGQADTYLALGHTWVYLDRAQQLQTINLRSAPDADAFEAPLILGVDQFKALLDASEVDSVMPELAREAPAAFLALPSDQRAAFTQRCLKLADDWQVHAFAQRVMVGVLALSLGEDFHLQATWAPWIAQLKQGRINLIQAIDKAVAT